MRIFLKLMLFQMVPATVVTTAIAGSTPTVVIANPANAHLSLPIGKISEIGTKTFNTLKNILTKYNYIEKDVRRVLSKKMTRIDSESNKKFNFLKILINI